MYNSKDCSKDEAITKTVKVSAISKRVITRISKSGSSGSQIIDLKFVKP